MIFGLSLKSLLRWRIVLPGLLVAVALAAGTWFAVPPTYQRSATMLLVPGAGSVPDEGNPYFYLAGLTQAADVVVRAVGSDNVRRDVEVRYPGVTSEVTRDPATAGPVILMVVDAPTDAEAAAVVDFLVQRAGDDLRDIQAADRILPSYRIQIRPISIDDHSTLRGRSRVVAAAAVGMLAVGCVALVAVVVELRSRRSSRVGADEAEESAGSDDTSTSSADDVPDWAWAGGEDEDATELDAGPTGSPASAGEADSATGKADSAADPWTSDAASEVGGSPAASDEPDSEETNGRSAIEVQRTA